MIKIGLASLKIGVPIACNVYDKNGKLLLRKGFVLESPHQVEVLFRDGLYIKSEPVRTSIAHPRSEPKIEQASIPTAISVLTQELKNQENLVRIIRGKTGHPDIHRLYAASVHKLITAVQRQRDLCMAYVFFNKTTENYPLRHSLDTAIIATIIANSLDKSPYETINIAAASLTMNISMLKLQEQLVSKAEPLSAEERAKINMHPSASATLLKQAGISNDDWLTFVQCHHEKNDWTGYPRGLKGDDIPEGAQIVCLADRYTATISPRSYRQGLVPNVVLRELLLKHGDTLCLSHAGVLTKVVGIYPPGMFVKLRNGEIAVVVSSGEDGACPRVKSIIGADNAPLPFPISRDTKKGPLRITASVRLEPERVPFDMVKIWGEEGGAG
ncbi:MAG: HD-GYP domain-containing protein [Methylococcaceae bacterium]